LAVNLDLWLDPVHTHKAWKSWIWLAKDPINVFSIPFSNFMGWFLVIFLFAVVFNRLPGMVRRWGPGRAAVYFYLILVGFEFCILASMITYGIVGMKLLPTPINFTIWGI